MGKGKCGYILTMPWGYFDKVSDFWEPDCWAAGLDQGCSPEPPDIKKKKAQLSILIQAVLTLRKPTEWAQNQIVPHQRLDRS